MGNCFSRSLTMKSIVFGSVVFVASAAPPDYDGLWASFKSKYGKTYDGGDSNGNIGEETMRFRIFVDNVKTIEAHNAKHANYKYGINEFTDLTTKEFVDARLGWKQPPPSQLYGDLPFLGNHTYDEGETLPDSVDHTSDGLVTHIKDQGQCGSCWIFSSVGALEGAYALARKELKVLAEQQVLDCINSIFPPTMGCSGGSMSPVFKFATSHGMCSGDSYVYEAKQGSCRSDSCTVAVPKGVFTGYKGLAPVARLVPASYKAMMSAVAQQPVSVSIEADKDVFHHYQSGIVDGACGQMPDHGVLVVGYGHDATAKEDYWKIKNSWGTSWGEAGYVRILRGNGIRGECAVLNSPSYPTASAGAVVV